MTNEERIALLAARAAAEATDGAVLGLGSGSTAEAVIRAIGARISGGLRVSGVSTSSRTTKLATECGIELIDLDSVERLDIGIDGADEIDPNLNLVKGRGGALLWEKLVARVCDEYLIVASSEKLVQQLGTRMPLPVEVIPVGWQQTARRIEATGCTATLRRGQDGAPLVTDGGHFIVDCATGPIREPISFAVTLKEITGVVEHGLFTDLATRALTIDEAGTISEHRPALD